MISDLIFLALWLPASTAVVLGMYLLFHRVGR
jgi:hypothetical protein